MLIAAYVVMIGMGILFRELRISIIKIICMSSILVLPQILLVKQNSLNQILFNPGFTISSVLSFKTFSLFWIWNLGFAIPIACYGFFVSNKFQRKIFLCFMFIFIAGNFFQFSRDIFDNHKFFNAWIISVNIFAAYAIYRIYNKGALYKTPAVVLLVLTILSGIFNFLVVKNDIYSKIPDSSKTNLGNWINTHVKSFDILLTNGEIYDPAAIVGARTFLGRPHYIFLYGGDPTQRLQEKNVVFKGVDDKHIKEILGSNGITYIIVYRKGLAPNLILANTHYLENHFKKIYEDDTVSVYKT
jgi:hypothetical protein